MPKASNEKSQRSQLQLASAPMANAVVYQGDPLEEYLTNENAVDEGAAAGEEANGHMEETALPILQLDADTAPEPPPQTKNDEVEPPDELIMLIEEHLDALLGSGTRYTEVRSSGANQRSPFWKTHRTWLGIAALLPLAGLSTGLKPISLRLALVSLGSLAALAASKANQQRPTPRDVLKRYLCSYYYFDRTCSKSLSRLRRTQSIWNALAESAKAFPFDTLALESKELLRSVSQELALVVLRMPFSEDLDLEDLSSDSAENLLTACRSLHLSLLRSFVSDKAHGSISIVSNSKHFFYLADTLESVGKRLEALAPRLVPNPLPTPQPPHAIPTNPFPALVWQIESLFSSYSLLPYLKEHSTGLRNVESAARSLAETARSLRASLEAPQGHVVSHNDNIEGLILTEGSKEPVRLDFEPLSTESLDGPAEFFEAEAASDLFLDPGPRKSREERLMEQKAKREVEAKRKAAREQTEALLTELKLRIGGSDHP